MAIGTYNKNVVLFSDGSMFKQWAFPPSTDEAGWHPIDEKYSAFYARNLVNRYRSNGVFAQEANWGDKGV